MEEIANAIRILDKHYNGDVILSCNKNAMGPCVIVFRNTEDFDAVSLLLEDTKGQ
jgi:hypothetical protein